MCTKYYDRECDACGDCNPSPNYYCPVCGEEVYESVYVSNEGDILGCENCAQIKEPHEVLENETDE
jgi:uncharacterized OB-fold protein